MNAFDPAFDALPATLPIFPLTGVLLLPRGRLPLNIFEPRYVKMIVDSLAAGRMFGMVQPSEANAEGQREAPVVYATGCAGRITHFEETEDGRFLLSLKGISRFNIVEEIPTTRGYRKCLVDWEPFRAALTPPDGGVIDRVRLIDAVRHYFTARKIEANWTAIEKADDEYLVTSIAMLCPFDPPEKQALLEAADLTGRAALLTTIAEMAAMGPSDGARQ